MQEVQIKAPKHEFTLLCDDIRQEMGGKTSLMGLYDHHIVVPQVPFTLPKVCFYTRFSRMDGQFKFGFSFEYVYKFAISDASRLQAEYEKAMAEGAKVGN